ncbi:MAG: hypothetical protein SGJ20_12660, partial [Planctomycetota bacterium]|nr:hypothetical protein [Planctomycetota bacterium]
MTTENDPVGEPAPTNSATSQQQDTSSGGSSSGDATDATKTRTIKIGTQRPGVAVPKLPPRTQTE